jgi:hypothetical protein
VIFQYTKQEKVKKPAFVHLARILQEEMKECLLSAQGSYEELAFCWTPVES